MFWDKCAVIYNPRNGFCLDTPSSLAEMTVVKKLSGFEHKQLYCFFTLL